ncbi:hypothetical protein ABH920_004086 [Catenulispora sp. EB89]|uniref:hypothetical protein n=1 Tax=Catenulispora sp. EB89 TaxID=3156257 RepID=UPI003511464D
MRPLTRVAALGATVAVAAWAGVESTRHAVSQPAQTRAVTATAEAPLHLHVPSRLAPEPASAPAVLAAPAVDPGTLPQTRALPSSADQQFQARLHALWQGIVDDDPQEAHPFFFPKTAYVQLKALWNAAGDYDYRLLGYFDLDVHAAHRLLGAGAQRAQLVGIDVPAGNAEWMTPGSEENKIPYYRLYGSRVRYTLDGVSHSFGVFSLLSWRGQWYAVHFGPWPRWERYGDVFQAR